jgi:hypothetical protein
MIENTLDAVSGVGQADINTFPYRALLNLTHIAPPTHTLRNILQILNSSRHISMHIYIILRGAIFEHWGTAEASQSFTVPQCSNIAPLKML